MRKTLLALLIVALLLSGGGAGARETRMGLSSDAELESLQGNLQSPSIDRRSIMGSRLFYQPLARESTNGATIAFTGDTLIHNTVTAAARRNGATFDFRPMFTDVRHLISAADLAICHLEVPLSPNSTELSSYPLFNAPAEVAHALAWAGFDACSTASNHSFDRGTDGVLGTLEVLDSAGIEQAGMADRIGDWWEPTIYRVGDLTLGHVSATYWLNGLRLPAEDQWLVQLLEPEEVLAVARRAKADGADLVVVSMHCCTEYRQAPTQEQIEVSHRLISSPDVDLVVTHHSHVVGPVERVGGEFIVHGLGNFLSGQIQSSSLRDGVIAMASAVLVEGEWRFESIEVVPTQVMRGSYRIEVADQASTDRTLAALNEMGADIGLASMQPHAMTEADERLLE